MSIISNKSCYGHTEGAAGLTGMLLAYQSCRAKALPPVMHLRSWNPNVTAALDTWQAKGKLAAGVFVQAAGMQFAAAKMNSLQIITRLP